MFLEFWEALEDAKDGRCYGLVAESSKLEKKKGSAQPRWSKKLGGLRCTG